MPKTIIDFLAHHNIITAIIALLLGSNINELSNELFDLIILPFINSKRKKEGKPKYKKFEDLEITIHDKEIKIGKCLLLITKLIIIIIIIYILARIHKIPPNNNTNTNNKLVIHS